MTIIHTPYDLPFLEIRFEDYHKAEDKEFTKEIIDSVYDALFEYLELRDFGMYKDKTIEILSFYYIPDKNTDKYIITILEQLKLLHEFEPKIKIYINHDRKNL